MSLKQCPACQATVDAAKSYCPDCGAPMEEELGRDGSSELDSMMRTQNISRTTQFRLMEDFNLSTIFTTKDITESDAGASETTQLSQPAQWETQSNQKKPETIVLQPQSEGGVSTKKPETTASSNKKVYIVVGIGLFIFALLLIVAIIIGILFLSRLR